MAEDTLQRWPAGSMAKGVDVNRSDLSPTFQLLPDSYNLTMGINEGLGPRYGTAPLAGHSDTEALAASTFPGLRKLEAGQGYTSGVTESRTQILGIIPFKMRGPGASGIDTISTYYAYIIGYTTTLGSGTYIDVLFGSTLDVNSDIQQFADARAGIPYVGPDSISSENDVGIFGLMGERIPVGTFPSSFTEAYQAKRSNILALTKKVDSKAYICATPFSISGANIPMQWVLGDAIVAPDATHPPSLGLNRISSNYSVGNKLLYFQGGPSEFNTGTFPKTLRRVFVYCIGSLDTVAIAYRMAYNVNTTIYKPNYIQRQVGVAQIAINTIASVKIGAGVGYATVDSALLNDPQITTSSAHQGVLVAAQKPMIFFFQDWYRATLGELQQYADPCNPVMPSVNPNFVNTAAFGAAGSGILRKDTAYEFGMSFYNKRLNHETNVVPIGTATTGADDFVNYIIFNGGGGAAFSNGTMAAAQMNAVIDSPILFPTLNTNNFYSTGLIQAPYQINFIEYRFYYRPVGQFEWLPALFVDASKYWFYPNYTAASPLAFCQGGIGGLTGGAPGAFNDYSPLPQDTYNCVVMYQNRAFWLSDKAIIYSATNNIFAYAGRNSAPCPIGSFKGAIVHNYPGQAQQSARLVVFSTSGTYVGRFTGQLQEVPVQVSTDTVANFGLDGSDFHLDSWTSNSAFSYRSAVVADGILYFWGPKGIFRDDGVATPTRISRRWEPDIFTYYDPARTDEILTVYNDTTKEIYWFFPPKVADGYPTHALVLSTETMEFVPAKFAFQVDASNALETVTDMGTAGNRTLLMSRLNSAATIQRAYYFDHRNRSGDYYPTGEFMVKQVSTPSAGIRRLTLAAGYDAAQFATIAAGDYICIQQVKEYAGAGLTTPSEMIATVNAVGAGTIDIELPDDTVLGNATLTHDQYFPVWHRTPTTVGVNGFPWNLTSKYWVPNGPNYWAYWLYLYFQFKLRLLASSFDQKIQLQYRTPVSAGYLTADDLVLDDNSDGNWQLYHPLTVGDQNMEGQGLKLVLSGIHIGSEWVLQYLEGHATQLEGVQLKIFEG